MAAAAVGTRAFSPAAGATLPPTNGLGQQIVIFLKEERIAGATFAIGRAGADPKVMAFGLAAPGRPMRTEDEFRLASLSKPITAAAVLALVRTGEIKLDATAPEGRAGIKVRHLLEHSAGWDRERSADPIADPVHAAALGFSANYRCQDIVRRIPPADFKPGSRAAYSNLGYCRLGQLIERVSGDSYPHFVERVVLQPRGARLTFEGRPTVLHPSQWPEAAYRALGAGGAWTGSAADYWRFAAGPVDPLVASRPRFAASRQSFYGFGWEIWPDGSLTHYGAIPGAFALVERQGDKVAVLLFNGRPADDQAAFVRLRKVLAATVFAPGSVPTTR